MDKGLIEKLSDQQLLEVVNTERGIYSEDYSAEARLELKDRGFVRAGEKWTKDLNAHRLRELEARIELLENERIPDTWLVSHSFWKRAFAAYGHMFVAGLILTVPVYLIASFFDS